MMNRKLTDDDREYIRRAMYRGVQDKVLMAKFEVSLPTITRAKKAGRAETARRASDTDGLYLESLGRYLEYEQMALDRNSIREARENRNAIVKLAGLAKGDRHALEVSGDVTTRIVFESVPRATEGGEF